MKKENIPTNSLSWAYGLCAALEQRILEIEKLEKIASAAYHLPVWLCFVWFGNTQKGIAQKLRKLKQAFYSENFNNLNNPYKNA